MYSTELKVPVPWGHISVKAWGDSTNESVITLHGGLDNAGSFDTLIPLLPRNFYYICVDLPGHGFSSHLPAGLPAVFDNFIFALQYVVEYFRKDKYVLIGHSIGGRLAVLFTQLYPHWVSKIAILDSGYPAPNEKKDHLRSLRKCNYVLKKNDGFDAESIPNHPYNVILKKLMENRLIGVLTLETADQLAKRMTKRVGDDRYEFTFDRRLRYMLFSEFSQEYLEDMFRKYPITCPALAIYTTSARELLEKDRGIYLHPPQFQRFEVDGHHHSHHTNPEIFAPVLTKFLTNNKCKL